MTSITKPEFYQGNMMQSNLVSNIADTYGKDITGAISVTNYENTTLNIRVFVALYNNNILHDIGVSDVTGIVSNGQNVEVKSTIRVPIPNYGDNYSLKMFVWKDVYTMLPIFEKKILQ
jgi:hypothetical protein